MDDVMNKLCDMKAELACLAKEALSGDVDSVDAKELSEVVDMIKDIYEAEKDCAKAKYYKTVVKAMGENDRSHRLGYIPMIDFDEEYDNYPRVPHRDWDEKYGRVFNEYRDARKHYTETHSTDDKSSMDGKAREHIDSVIVSIREIWNNADPTLRQQMKSQLTSLINEMA